MDLVRPFKNNIFWMFQKVPNIIPSALYGYLMGVVGSRNYKMVEISILPELIKNAVRTL